MIFPGALLVLHSDRLATAGSHTDARHIDIPASDFPLSKFQDVLSRAGVSFHDWYSRRFQRDHRMFSVLSKYFDHLTQQLHSKIQQAKVYITKHNPTTGALAEAVLREFLQEHLPRGVSVEEGFIISPDGWLSKQCDIIIYDSHRFAPFYRAGQLVVVPTEAVLAVIEVKTSINKKGFNDVIRYFQSFEAFSWKFRTYLFMFNAPTLGRINAWFHSYPHPGHHKEFDHDTYQVLPDEIIGLDSSYQLRKEYVIHNRDGAGYMSYFYLDQQGTAISALELFFLSVNGVVEAHLQAHTSKKLTPREQYHPHRALTSISAIDLFPM